MSGTKTLRRLETHLAASVAVAAAASAAQAVVITWNCNLAIPSNLDGFYINVAAQTFGTSATSTPGWDINPYGSGTLSFFASAASPNPTTTYVRTQASGGPSSLALGTVISGASTFTNSTAAVITSAGAVSNGWQLNSINYFGFRFNPGTTVGEVRYGYGVMQVGATAATRTLLSISWEDSGGAITVVPAPGALALIGAAGLVGGRRRRR